MGAIAREKLSQEREASVMGMTSRGLFLRLASGWVVFLSSEAYRGPLTLNFKGDPSDFGALMSGSPARLSPDYISFPDSRLAIHTGQTAIWQAPPLPVETLPPDQRLSQIALVARQLLAKGGASEFGMLLPVLIGDEDTSKLQENRAFPLMQRLQRSLREGKLTGIAESLQAILGMGIGLTPSGDDVVMGCLLALTRWGHTLAPNLKVNAFASNIVQQAYRKTTTLSANLIECASQGQANERLTLALDGMLSGKVDAATCAGYLSGWGKTSGLDSLAGMALALNMANESNQQGRSHGTYP